MRYAIVTAIVFAVLAGLTWLTGQYLRASTQAEIRQLLRDAQARGELPADFDPESAEFTDMGTVLNDRLLNRILWADFIHGVSWLWIPCELIIALIIGTIITRFLPHAPV